MKNWKAYVAGFLVLCLCLMTPLTSAFAEENHEEQETEEPIPESYYYEIESNGIENWPQGPAIESAAAVVMDMDTGTFLYSKQATEKMYPASITKIMTTLLLLEHCDLDDTVTFSEIVYDLEEGSSHLGIQPGEEMTIRDAAYGIMLASANDLSNGIAEYIGGSISGFADLMNERAAEIGCVNTHFSNPHGLYSEDHYTCAYDMALIAAEAYENEMFRKIAGTKEYTIPETNLVEEQRSFLNHHKMIQKDSEYYREWCKGGKNGFTSQCLNTLVTFYEKEGQNLVAVVLRVNGAGKAYSETIEILAYALDNFDNKIYEKSASNKTFYDIMGLGYFGNASKFQSTVWKNKPTEVSEVNITLPNNGDIDFLSYDLVQENGNEKVVAYKYNGQPVGTAKGSFKTIYAPVQLVFEKEIEDSSSVLSTDIQIESLDEVLTQTMSIFDTGYKMIQDYAEDHFVIVAAGGIILLIILIISIVVLIFRNTADARIRRRRKQEEIERRKREEEIEKMTTAEIEAELRMVMEQERLRKENEERARAEAERAAEEARKLNEKAHETERLIEELERERQERLASE